LDPEPGLIFLDTLDTNLLFGSLVIVLLLLCSAMVSAAEVALFSLSQNDLTKLSHQNPAKSQLVSQLLQKPKKLLATLLLANNFVNIGIVIIFSFVSDSLFEGIVSPVVKFVVEVMLVTFLILLFGEVLPKVYASRNNIKFSIRMARSIWLLDQLLSPLSLPMRAMTVYLHKKLGKQKPNISVDQLSQALEMTSPNDTTSEEQKILEGIVSFGNTDTKQVMSPKFFVPRK
jgi:putative hemolysin